VVREKVNTFSCNTKALMLLDWAVPDEKLSMPVLCRKPPIDRGRILNYLKSYSIHLKE